jgi:hypothetical protein
LYLGHFTEPCPLQVLQVAIVAISLVGRSVIVGQMLLELGDGKLNRCKNIIRHEVVRQERTIKQDEAEPRFIG